MPAEPGYFPYGRPDFRASFPFAELKLPFFCHGGISLQKKPIILDEHSHAGYELHFIRAGAMPQTTSGGEQLPAQGGDIVVMQPGTLHRGDNNIIPKSHILWLEFRPQHKSPRQSIFTATQLQTIAARLRGCGNRVARAGGDVAQVFDRCLHLLQADSDPFLRQQSLRILLCDFLLLALRDLEQGGASQLSTLTMQALAVMADDLSTAIHVEQLAEQLGVSSSRFYDVFKTDTGLTPADHHLRMRLAASRDLLMQHKELSIAAVAAQYGFSNARHFATVFKRFSGMSPRDFRAGAMPHFDQ